MKNLKSLTLAAVLCAFAALIVAVLPLGALGYGEEQGFSTQALLNKPGVTFDPTPLKNYADKDGSVVIKVVEAPDYYDYSDDDATYDEPQPGDKNGGGDDNDSYSDEGSTEVARETPDGSEGGSINDFLWAPGTYYIYRSHYNSELGVVVSEVDESYAYYDENGFEEKWINISGVQVTIVVPTKWEIQNFTYEWRELTVNQSSPLNQSLIDLAVSLGYLDLGAEIYSSEDTYYYTEENKENETSPPEPPPEPVTPTSYNMLYFMKDNVSITISSGLGGKTSEGPSEANQTWISVSGMNGDTSKEPYVSDIKKMMSYLGISSSLWDEATFQSYTYPMPIQVPAIDLDISTIDWPAAMRAELEWLVKENVISGLQSSDIDDICNLTVPSPMWVYDRVMYMDGKWTYGSAFWDGRMPVVEGVGPDLSSPPSPTGDSGGLLSDGNSKDSSTNNVGSEAMPMTIFAPGTGTADNNNKMSQMTMIIAIIALCATFLIIIVLGVLGFTRLRRNSILDNLNRKNIYELVKSKPGIHFNELIRTLNMQPGVLSHHLNILESEEYIKSLQDANHRRFYLYGTNTERKIMLTDIQLKILAVVSKSPGISQSNISKSIGRNRMIVNYHIKILRDVNMLQLEKSGRESMCYITDVAKLSMAS